VHASLNNLLCPSGKSMHACQLQGRQVEDRAVSVWPLYCGRTQGTICQESVAVRMRALCKHPGDIMQCPSAPKALILTPPRLQFTNTPTLLPQGCTSLLT
jgi:hypothetical protein